MQHFMTDSTMDLLWFNLGQEFSKKYYHRNASKKDDDKFRAIAAQKKTLILKLKNRTPKSRLSVILMKLADLDVSSTNVNFSTITEMNNDNFLEFIKGLYVNISKSEAKE